MNILIIGGSRFIGWRFIELLGNTRHSVTVINRGNNHRSYPSNVTHKIADRNDYDAMVSTIGNSEFDAVFDMCGFVKEDMAHIVKLFGSRTEKYVFISTAATYLEPNILPISEDHPQGNHSVWGKYGSGKLACERVLLSAYEDTGFPVVIVRPSYVYGMGNTIDRETFIFDRITNHRKILIPGDGEAVIQLGEVTDLCNALLKIAESPKASGLCYNISGNEYVTLNSFVALIAKIIGTDHETLHVDPKKYGMSDRDVFPFDNVTYFTSSERFSEDYGWTPGVTLVNGLTTAYHEWLNPSEKRLSNYDNEDTILENIQVD